MKLTQVSFDKLASFFDEIDSWNDPDLKVKDYDIYQFQKNKDSRFDWWVAFEGSKFVGAMGVDKGRDWIYLNEIMAKPGVGYGTKMMKNIFDHYVKTMPNLKSIKFDSYSARDKENDTNNLANHYAKHFPDFDQKPNAWGGTTFTKNLKKQNESKKISFTELKRLIYDS